jgi:alpha-ketoglutarate-dependent taurine dioxygenase
LYNAPGALRLSTSDSYTDDDLRLLYAMISRSLGYLNNRYTYFFDVKDRGLDYTKEAIPVSKTKAETGYHTDSTAKHYFPDIVGLLCLQPALSGGESLITNAANLLAFLQYQFPRFTELLHTPLFRDVITPGTVQDLSAIRSNDIPLFQYDEHGGVIFRYMRYWIESALEKLNEPAPKGLTELLDTIDSYFAHNENAMCFRLERGQMLFVNNRFICHNRTAFIDGDKPRVYVRAWINQQPQE